MDNSKDTVMEDIVRRLEFVETHCNVSIQEARALRKANRRMERANRRITWVSLALGAMLVLVFALAAVKPAATQDVIRAKRLEIVDDKGKTRISLDIGPGADPLLNVYDGKGNPRVLLGRITSGYGLVLANGKREDRASLLLRSDDAVWLYFSDKTGPGRAYFDLTSRGPEIIFTDENNKVIWQAPPK